MRVGLWGTGLIFAIIFLTIINYSGISPEKIDLVFEGIDVNVMSEIDQNISDVNLGKFAKYTVKGILEEMHGFYYLVSWANPMLPEWIVPNLGLILFLILLAFISPVLFYGAVTVVIVAQYIKEKINKRRRLKNEVA